MSDTNNETVDSAPQPNDVQPVAPAQGGQGEPQGSTPASVDPTVPTEGEQPVAEDASKAAARREARAFASLRRENQQLQRELGRIAGLMEARAPAHGTPAEPPQQSQYRTYEDYTAAIARHAATEAAQQTAAQLHQQTLQRVEGEASQRKAQAFRKTLEGQVGKDVVESLYSEDLAVSDTMAMYLIDEAEAPAELARWLVANPDEAERIAKEGRDKAGKTLARIDARLAMRGGARLTSTPPPPPMVNGRSSPSFNPEKASMAEYAKYWTEREAKKGR